MRLLLDLGNSRLKAALGSADGRLQRLGEAPHRGPGLADALRRALPAGLPDGVTTALCANVAGEAAGRALAGALQDSGCRVAFLHAQREAGGVRCAYLEPARLGPDRWAALLGARGLTEGACLVADAGSALTLDAMAPGGRHLGGWILPGLAMMLEALETRTGNLEALRRASPPDEKEPLFPIDTGPAMEQGAQLAAAGALLAARRRLEAACGVPARVFLAGGDAPSLLEVTDGAEHVPDLVLRGLARAATM